MSEYFSTLLSYVQLIFSTVLDWLVDSIFNNPLLIFFNSVFIILFVFALLRLLIFKRD